MAHHWWRMDVFLFKALMLAFLVVTVLGDDGDLDEPEFKIDEVRWGLTNANKTSTCILLNGIFQVIVPYQTNNNMRDIALLTVPTNASVYGHCGESTQSISLRWLPKSGVEEDEPATNKHNITFTFVLKGQVVGEPDGSTLDTFYELDTVDGIFYAGEAEFPNFNHDKTEFTLHASDLGMLSAPVGLSYFCESSQVIYSETEETNLVMSFVQSQAFHKGLSETGPDGKDFGPRSYCPRDGYQMIFSVVGYVLLLTLVGVAVFIVINRKAGMRNGYVYL